ncbi:MAG: hypothetical protein J0L91_12140 [Burkholderiales bacterium]|nr:hypothetical protein [Burkholderiales bacterium]
MSAPQSATPTLAETLLAEHDPSSNALVADALTDIGAGACFNDARVEVVKVGAAAEDAAPRRIPACEPRAMRSKRRQHVGRHAGASLEALEDARYERVGNAELANRRMPQPFEQQFVLARVEKLTESRLRGGGRRSAHFSGTRLRKRRDRFGTSTSPHLEPDDRRVAQEPNGCVGHAGVRAIDTQKRAGRQVIKARGWSCGGHARVV